jgi:hypothetical protein
MAEEPQDVVAFAVRKRDQVGRLVIDGDACG